MAIYSVGRRRVVIALLLTSALLLTLDLRGSPIIDRSRDIAARALDPVETAIGVVTTPVSRAWNGIAHYDDVRSENEALQDQLDRLIGTQAAAEAAVIRSQELQALNNLPALADIDTVVATVIGEGASNFDQVVEIDKGRSAGIAVGMPVVNQAGLIGKVTSVTDNSARVMLVTDRQYAVGVSVTSSSEPFDVGATENTTPSGITPDDAADAVSTTTTTTTTPDEGATGGQLPVPDTTLPGGVPGVTTTLSPLEQEALEDLSELSDEELAQLEDDLEAALEIESTTTTTTTEPEPVVVKETGALEGRGGRLLPQIRFVQDSPQFAVLAAGDLVETAGGSESLAPPGIPVGRVANRANRAGSGGPLLDVELHADLDRLNFVRVVLYRPLAEVEQ
ncbi:MAG: rod shape-determining protein MreC [Ilumatobacteraceae bacterium]|nr:rod shape-determining protein MreC [Ilumatobacteraceae bacterium]